MSQSDPVKEAVVDFLRKGNYEKTLKQFIVNKKLFNKKIDRVKSAVKEPTWSQEQLEAYFRWADDESYDVRKGCLFDPNLEF